jgi:hypothetical protein
MSGNDAAVSSGYSLLNYNPALNLAVGSVVHPSGLIQAVQDEWKTSGQNNLYAKKLIKKIQLRNTVIEFDYAMALSPGNVTNYKTAIISSITYRSIAGDLIKKVVFVINEAGFLKSVKTLSSLNTLEKNYSFNYFDEGTALSRFSQDYWGYYNGKPNQSLLPLDPNYYIPVGNVRVPVFSPQTPPNYTYFDNTEYPPGDRLPDAQFSKARSLKSVSDHLGGTTNFEYEGNEIFILMADKNVQVGGIRIKSVKTEDATGQVRKLNYKYAFPLLNDASKIRSTGEFFEWATRGFSELHANDEHIHSHMDYNGIHCLPVGSNDVLYHYVEEQAEDNSATGYKFFAVNALNSAPHNDLLDGKLMAQISYDASGKIVSVRKYQYATNFGIEHSRSDEVGFMNYSAVPYLINEGTSAELVRQHKKVKIFYDRDDILRFSSAAMDILGWNGNSLGIPSVGKMIYDNYYPRSSQSTAGLPYELTAGIFVRPTSSTVYTFSDYAPSVIPGSAPAVPTDEKAYLFEKLLASSAERAQQIVRYFYESAVTQQPTRIESTDSKGRIRITKHKYVCDYASDAAPFIAQLKAAGRNFDLVETQQWISTNGGSTFKLMNGAITRFEEKQSDNRTFVLPVEKLNYLPNEPADLTSYGQSATATGPYSSVFWENHALYKQEQTYNWQLNALFAKLQGTTDRTGHLGDLNCYDNLTGNLLIKAVGVNPGAIAGVDMAPFQSHSKYAVKGWFKSEIPVINPTVYTFSDRPFSNGLVGPFFDYVTYATGALERLNEWWQRGQQGDIPSELGNHRLFAEMIPLFYSIKSRVPLEAFVEQMHFFRKAMATIEMDPEFMNLVFTYLDVADFLELLQSTETISNMCSPDFSIYEREIINIPQHMSQLSSTPLNIEKARLASNKLDVYVVRPENQAAGNVQYKVKYRNGTISAFYTIIPAVINERIVKATLDLTTISNPADAVEIQFASNWSCYAVPQGVSFEAYTYLPDNQQMLSFNQTGRYTEKVYDEYGDVVQVTDNKHIATANTISFSGKGDAVTSEIIPVKVINEPHLMHTGPVVKRITLYQGAPFMETKIVESTFRVIPGSEYTFNIRKGIYRIEVELENVFTTVTVNGVQYAGAMTVNLNTANELLIHVSAQP